ncbi:hypothetical protein Z946_215 [Sulfitobacter noctilucicola]|uniref:Uncharacterized protein n=1 Tax=Sulfitobacter noctilucicola TaxID=1342301 RepID=A0A7W6MCG0_9RHOB|nr:DUF6447 family protein [Sulfitobacter noctilucicola]KIN69849.1 hypothetical protein Z946_215 [Sulfitobacter noctilucicola]MBB4176217.1 hypothetical protein [Sulfitobacter noctilucicola]
MAKIKIDDKEYETDDLSSDAKDNLTNMRLCDERLTQIRRDAAITQTARNAYAAALKSALPKDA